MEQSDNKTLYIFIDEAGNFDFTPTGTKYFVLTSVTTTHPLKDREKFSELRYSLLRNGVNQELFHATEDRQEVRDMVFATLGKLNDIEVDSVVAQKNKANPSLYIEIQSRKVHRKPNEILRISDVIKTKHSGEKIYKLLSQTLLQYIFRRYEPLTNINRVVVILGSIFHKEKREFVLKSLKQYLKQKTEKPFYVYFHKAEADINCQLADYCGWAIYVDVERGEGRPLQSIRSKFKGKPFDIFARGDTEYYQYKK